MHATSESQMNCHLSSFLGVEITKLVSHGDLLYIHTMNKSG